MRVRRRLGFKTQLALVALARSLPALCQSQSPDHPPPCSASQTRLSFDGMGGAMGTEFITIVVENLSSSSCMLSGSPQIERISARGRRMPTHIDWPSEAGATEGSSSEVLQPQAQGYFVIAASNRTGLPLSYHCASKLRISLPAWSHARPLEVKVETCAENVWVTGYLQGSPS